MSIEARKIDLVERLLKVRESSILKKVEELLDAEIVAHTVDAKPLNRKAYKMELKKAEEDLKKHEEDENPAYADQERRLKTSN